MPHVDVVHHDRQVVERVSVTALDDDVADLATRARPSPSVLLTLAMTATTLTVLLAWWSAEDEVTEPLRSAAVASAAAVEDEEELPQTPGHLSVRANLSGAIAEVSTTEDGATAQSIPADGTPIELEAGTYRIRVGHPECPDFFVTQVEVRSAESVDAAASVCNETGWLVVRSDQLGDRLFIDGEPVGATGPRRHALAPGVHEVRVQKPGFADWRAVARTSAASERTLRARLEGLGGAAEVDLAASTTEAPGGSRGWHAAVSQSLVRRYDRDLSGYIDTDIEVASIPCEEWRGLERSYETGGLSVPMSRLYGFDGSRWVKDALGFDLRVRDDSYERMRQCGLR